MNKKLKIAIIALFIFIGGSFAAYAANGNTKNAEKSPVLTTQQVKSMVLEKYDGVITELELEKGKNGAYYEVEVKTEDSEVELKIDAYTGKILFIETESIKSKDQKVVKEETKTENPSKKTSGDEKKTSENVQLPESVKNQDDQDDDKDVKTNTEKKYTPTKKTKETKTVISTEDAIRIAEEKTGAKVIEIEKDYDDGILKYEIELLSKTQEFELEINAYTGEIIEMDVEDRFNDDWDDNNDDDEE